MNTQPYLVKLPQKASLIPRATIPRGSWELAALEISWELGLDKQKLSEEFSQQFTQEYNIVSEGWSGKEKDLSKLSEPIHQQFANWETTPESALRFTKRFGFLESSPDTFSEWVVKQIKFRQYWKWNNQESKWDALIDAFSKEFAPVVFFTSDDENSMPHMDFEPNIVLLRVGLRLTPELIPQNLWQYLLIRLMEEQLGRLRVCENPECFSPYFIARRKDQQFCGSDCAGLVAKRRWWKKHGNEWRRARKKTKKKGKTKKKKS